MPRKKPGGGERYPQREDVREVLKLRNQTDREHRLMIGAYCFMKGCSMRVLVGELQAVQGGGSFSIR
jgi:hypothetical protein